MSTRICIYNSDDPHYLSLSRFLSLSPTLLSLPLSFPFYFSFAWKVLYFKGGAWCTSPADCYSRAQGSLGSSARLVRLMPNAGRNTSRAMHDTDCAKPAELGFQRVGRLHACMLADLHSMPNSFLCNNVFCEHQRQRPSPPTSLDQSLALILATTLSLLTFITRHSVVLRRRVSETVGVSCLCLAVYVKGPLLKEWGYWNVYKC